MKKVKAYKGFDKDLKCRDFQYAVGGEYEEPKAELCNCGFHACEAPLDVLYYYPPADSRYCAVDLDGVSDKKGDDTKRVGKKIKIGAEIGLPRLAAAHVEWVKEHVDWKNAKESNTGNQSAATNTGKQSAATNTGYQSAATNTGYQSAATNTGDYSAATNTGNQSAATIGGKNSVAIVTGLGSKAKGAVGCWLVIVERGDWNGETYPIKTIKAVCVDGEIVKADTFYKVINGELVEADED